MTVVSFDIDGTLVIGDPPGAVTLEMVRRARTLGYVIGSCSDRPIRNQEELWAANEIAVDFVALKHRLDEVRSRFPARRYVHIGDTDVDRHFARLAGFDFFHVNELPADGTDGWIF
jgi:phosphoglycolate phosphatase-like HAD superfamily hydrolase